MKLNLTSLTFTILTAVLFTSCGGGGSSSSSTVTDTSGGSTTSSKTFVDVNKVISTNCLSCHGATPTNGAPMSLTTFNQISFNASSISTRINKLTGDSQLMPLNAPKLSTTDIATIDSWIAGGKLNN